MSDARPKTGIDLSLVQVLAGTGAALTAALLGSLFGIAGTLLGTAVGSAVASICTALYTHQLHRTRERLQRRGGRRSESLRPTWWRPLPWLRLLAAAAVVFGVALTALTVVEATLGHPLSSPSGPGSDRGGASTSLGRALAPDLRPGWRSRQIDRLPAGPPRSSASPSPSQPAPSATSVTPSESVRRPAQTSPHEQGPASGEPSVRPPAPQSEPPTGSPSTSGPFGTSPSDLSPPPPDDASTDQTITAVALGNPALAATDAARRIRPSPQLAISRGLANECLRNTSLDIDTRPPDRLRRYTNHATESPHCPLRWEAKNTRVSSSGCC